MKPELKKWFHIASDLMGFYSFIAYSITQQRQSDLKHWIGYLTLLLFVWYWKRTRPINTNTSITPRWGKTLFLYVVTINLFKPLKQTATAIGKSTFIRLHIHKVKVMSILNDIYNMVLYCHNDRHFVVLMFISFKSKA